MPIARQTENQVDSKDIGALSQYMWPNKILSPDWDFSVSPVNQNDSRGFIWFADFGGTVTPDIESKGGPGGKLPNCIFVLRSGMQ
jgi:hypothetical protein